MATSLFTGVFSVVPTRRRRFLWAAWWTAPPAVEPFREPDAATGGARTREEARAQAEAAAGRTLCPTEARWAGAWVRVLRGEPPWPKARAGRDAGADATRPPRPAPTAAPRGTRPWALGVLGLATGATPAEIRRAFRALALRTHPDRGGDDAAFIDAKRAHDLALGAADPAARRRRAR